ncbi:hypothetical protein FRC0024_02435 [Corynebacterium diphtheriae]|nr:hypothetical protein FRC0024_02435 [Corynebacterium diphtheriae]CAB0867564.1 hypothetical protein FRC0314_02405 [Corynebacterium diphtheriae]
MLVLHHLEVLEHSCFIEQEVVADGPNLFTQIYVKRLVAGLWQNSFGVERCEKIPGVVRLALEQVGD